MFLSSPTPTYGASSSSYFLLRRLGQPWPKWDSEKKKIILEAKLDTHALTQFFTQVQTILRHWHSRAQHRKISRLRPSLTRLMRFRDYYGKVLAYGISMEVTAGYSLRKAAPISTSPSLQQGQDLSTFMPSKQTTQRIYTLLIFALKMVRLPSRMGT